MHASWTHDDIIELLGAYALDAVEPDEAEAIERHLEDCPRCAQEVDAFREVAGSLAFSGGTAPDGVWERIAAQLEEKPPPLDMERFAPVVPIERGRRRRRGAGGPRPLVLRVAAVAAAEVVVGALAGLTAEVARLQHRIDGMRTNVATAPAGRAVSITLRSPDGALSVPVVIGPDGNGYVSAGNLPPLPATETYQLWAISNGQRISIGVLGSSFDVGTFALGAEPAGAAARHIDAIAITREPAPGVSTSVQAPVVLSPLPRQA
jgi:hypothetical protein